ncbi:hypothetical protein BIWAKO_01767 [Bosea sp. BIWAKO-01]|nr:hypothetical protein BIWAKO_01767 [Bosea sp. BIWAKO-01]
MLVGVGGFVAVRHGSILLKDFRWGNALFQIGFEPGAGAARRLGQS